MSDQSESGPQVSFGAYVKPETVQEAPEAEAIALPFISARRQPRLDAPVPAPPQRINPAFVAMSLIGVLTFLLGVMVTLYLSKSPQAEMALALPDAAISELNPVPQKVPTDVLAAVVTASLEGGVTRNAPSDLITPSGSMSQPQTDGLSMNEILLGLTPERAVAGAAAQQGKAVLGRDKLWLLRERVLSGNYTVKTVERHGRERLRLRIPTGNVTPDEAADLIMRAVERGEIALPPSLSTADGSFDADTLIFNLVQTSLANDGTEAGKRAAEEMSRRAFAASVAKSKKVTEGRIYVVEPGDSLAYISLQFYGRPSSYLKIFEANRAILKSPDRIQIGQRLIIPS